ncbi:MAG: hypothetical protein AAF417_00430 [Pseudomonadota bacterium]
MSKEKMDKNQDHTSERKTPAMSRRSLLKGGISAMPAVLTLQSGAALARSSNLISVTHRGNHKDHWGRTLCLDTKSVDSVNGSRRVYDLGHPAYGRVAAIRDRQHYGLTPNGIREVDESLMCRRGGVYYYRERGRYRWHDSRRELSEQEMEQLTAMQAADSGLAGRADLRYGSGGYDGGWQRVKVHRGVLVSATALSSFSGNIVVKDI